MAPTSGRVLGVTSDRCIRRRPIYNSLRIGVDAVDPLKTAAADTSRPQIECPAVYGDGGGFTLHERGKSTHVQSQSEMHRDSRKQQRTERNSRTLHTFHDTFPRSGRNLCGPLLSPLHASSGGAATEGARGARHPPTNYLVSPAGISGKRDTSISHPTRLRLGLSVQAATVAGVCCLLTAHCAVWGLGTGPTATLGVT
eukprot:5236613-Prymnesium_polylepis.1